jgi:hypothetical protein
VLEKELKPRESKKSKIVEWNGVNARPGPVHALKAKIPILPAFRQVLNLARNGWTCQKMKLLRTKTKKNNSE